MNHHTRPRPSLFIVGAPKCGTSWAATMLVAHPDVFVPIVKEPHYFGSDLTPRGWSGHLDLYLDLFNESGRRPCIDGSTFYLSSTCAAKEIHEFDPNAKILIMLRHPVTVIESLHSQLLFDATEDLEDVNDALAAVEDRRQGRRIPRSSARPEALDYPTIVRFGDQVERFFDMFGSDQCLVLLHDELRNDAEMTRERILQFFGLDPARGDMPGVINERKQVRSKRVRQLYRSVEQSDLLKGPIRKVFSPSARWHLAYRLKIWNSRPADAQRVSATAELNLLAELRVDIDKLEGLLGRDLSEWKKPRPVGAR